MTDSDEEIPEQVDVERARVLVAKREAIVIDVRGEEEFAEERIFGSVRCDPAELEARLDEMDSDGEEDRDVVLLVSADGSESAELAERLRGGSLQVANLEGGLDAWTGEHLPTAPGRDEEYAGPAVKLPGAVASDGGGDDEEDPDADEAEVSEGERARPSEAETTDEEKAERAEDR